jgi:predicted  nucleic acid-binding Zn-ribbon protein
MSTTKTLLRQRMDECRAQVDAIKARTAPQRAERDALLAQQSDMDARINELTVEIRADDIHIVALKSEISAIASGLGASRLSGG